MRDWLIRTRKEKLMTQLAVSSHVGISRAYYAQIELAQRDPSIRVARKISHLLDFDWTRFYEETETTTAFHAGKPHGYPTKGGGQIT